MENKKKCWINILVVFVPLLVFMIWIFTKWYITYQVHDDRYMMEFLSGKFLGYSDAHLVYIKYPLAFLIQCFYKLFPSHDWYALVMVMTQFAMIGINTYYIVRKQDGIAKKVLSQVVFYSLFFLCWLNEVTRFTYSTVAAFVGVTVIVVYVLGEDRIRDFALLLVLCFVSFNMRTDLFLMVLPICGILWLYKTIYQKEKRGKQLAFLGCLAIVLGASYGCHYLAYSNDGWSNYVEYNKARTEVYDYAYGDLVQYDQNIEMYEALGISREQCAILKSYDLYLYDMELIDLMDDIADAYENPRSLAEQMKSGIGILFLEGFMKSKIMTLVSVVLWGMAIMYLIYNRDKKHAILALGFVCVHVVLWLYLGYKARIMPRVSHSVLLMQIVTPLLCMYCSSNEKGTKNINAIWKKVGFACLMVVTVAICAYDVNMSGKLIRRNQTEQESGDQYAIEEYCNSHLDNFYFLDVLSVVECKYVFDFNNPNTYENFLSLGDWFSNSPIYQSKLEKEGIESVRDAVLYEDNVYVIGIAGGDLNFIKGITDRKVDIVPVDYLDGGMDDYIVYQIQCEE